MADSRRPAPPPPGGGTAMPGGADERAPDAGDAGGREAVEARLRERLDDLQTLLEVVPVGIALADSADCAAIMLNSHGARLTGTARVIPPAGDERARYRFLRDGREVPAEALPLQTVWRTGVAVEDFRATFLRDDGTAFELTMSATPVFDARGALRRVIGVYDDITGLSRVQQDAERRAAQQAYVAALGTRSLRGQSLEALLESVAGEVAQVLSADFTKVLQYRPISDDFELCASFGFDIAPGARILVPGGNRSQAGYALASGEPVFVEDLVGDPRFQGPELLVGHGARSGLSVAIGDFGNPWGVLGVHARQRRSFDKHDVQFLQAVANVIAATVARDETERHQRILLAELQHRVKNSLATVQAIASLSFRKTAGIGADLEVFGSRIRALSTAHDLLFQQNWRPIELAAIVAAQLGPFTDKAGRIAVEGSGSVVLGSNAATEMGIVLHELATNAVKYGALSSDEGRVAIAWSTSPGEAGRQLCFEWRESGGPPLGPPTSKGIGTTLIGSAFHGFPGSRTALDFRPEGLVCSIRIPLAGA